MISISLPLCLSVSLSLSTSLSVCQSVSLYLSVCLFRDLDRELTDKYKTKQMCCRYLNLIPDLPMYLPTTAPLSFFHQCLAVVIRTVSAGVWCCCKCCCSNINSWWFVVIISSIASFLGLPPIVCIEIYP